LFSDYFTVDITIVNNLYKYFNGFKGFSYENPEKLEYEKKIIKVVLNILKNEKFAEIDNDCLVINKLLSFCYFLVDDFPLKLF